MAGGSRVGLASAGMLARGGPMSQRTRVRCGGRANKTRRAGRASPRRSPSEAGTTAGGAGGVGAGTEGGDVRAGVPRPGGSREKRLRLGGGGRRARVRWDADVLWPRIEARPARAATDLHLARPGPCAPIRHLSSPSPVYDGLRPASLLHVASPQRSPPMAPLLPFSLSLSSPPCAHDTLSICSHPAPYFDSSSDSPSLSINPRPLPPHPPPPSLL